MYIYIIYDVFRCRSRSIPSINLFVFRFQKCCRVKARQEAVDFFFEHASPTGVGPALRMQLACGSGKTYIYGMIAPTRRESDRR